jgi:hypothetical protein
MNREASKARQVGRESNAARLSDVARDGCVFRLSDQSAVSAKSGARRALAAATVFGDGTQGSPWSGSGSIATAVRAEWQPIMTASEARAIGRPRLRGGLDGKWVLDSEVCLLANDPA